MSEVNPAVAALIARYRTAPAATPNVNPPEAAKVLESQTAPEIVAPAPELDVPALATAVADFDIQASSPLPPAPAASPKDPNFDVIGVAPKAKRGPGRPPKTPAAEPQQLTAGSVGLVYATTEQIVAELRDRGYRVTLEER